MNEFTEEAGTTRWYLYNIDRETILEEPGEIVTSIRSTPETPRRCTTEEKMLLDVRKRIGPIQEKWRRPTPFALLLPRI